MPGRESRSGRANEYLGDDEPLSRGEGIEPCPGVAIARFQGWVKPLSVLGVPMGSSPAQFRRLTRQRGKTNFAQLTLGRAMNLHPHGMNRARLHKRAGVWIENTRARRHLLLGDLDDIEKRKGGRIARQHKAAVHAPRGIHQSRARQPLQDLRDEEIGRRGRFRDLTLGRQTVARAGQVDEATDSVVDLPKEVHAGPIMQRSWWRDEQLLAAHVCSPAFTTHQEHARQCTGQREPADG